MSTAPSSRLSDEPRFVRSSTRPYPFDEEPLDGLLAEDINGDGHIFTMRVPDTNGRWKKDPDDPRLMIERGPTEEGGDYFMLLPDGRIRNYDGVTVTPRHAKEGLDLNRNWPSYWKREHEQQGAGPFPLSEPETHAQASFISSHPNIVTWIAGHSFTGVLLRAGYNEPDDKKPITDEAHLQDGRRKGHRAFRLSGDQCLSRLPLWPRDHRRHRWLGLGSFGDLSVVTGILGALPQCRCRAGALWPLAWSS